MKNNHNVPKEGAESTKILLRPLRKPSVLCG
jgi:hypothetical protein